MRQDKAISRIGKSMSPTGKRRRGRRYKPTNHENCQSTRDAYASNSANDIFVKLGKTHRSPLRIYNRNAEKSRSYQRGNENIFSSFAIPSLHTRMEACTATGGRNISKEVQQVIRQREKMSATRQTSTTNTGVDDRPIPAKPSNPLRFKTELCRAHEESGFCRFGVACTFAHGPAEMRQIPRHHKYKTEPCRSYHTVGYCQYGTRCHFVHDADNTNSISPVAKSLSLDAGESNVSGMNKTLDSMDESHKFRGHDWNESNDFSKNIHMSTVKSLSENEFQKDKSRTILDIFKSPESLFRMDGLLTSPPDNPKSVMDIILFPPNRKTSEVLPRTVCDDYDELLDSSTTNKNAFTVSSQMPVPNLDFVRSPPVDSNKIFYFVSPNQFDGHPDIRELKPSLNNVSSVVVRENSLDNFGDYQIAARVPLIREQKMTGGIWESSFSSVQSYPLVSSKLEVWAREAASFQMPHIISNNITEEPPREDVLDKFLDKSSNAQQLSLAIAESVIYEESGGSLP